MEKGRNLVLDCSRALKYLILQPKSVICAAASPCKKKIVFYLRLENKNYSKRGKGGRKMNQETLKYTPFQQGF